MRSSLQLIPSNPELMRSNPEIMPNHEPKAAVEVVGRAVRWAPSAKPAVAVVSIDSMACAITTARNGWASACPQARGLGQVRLSTTLDGNSRLSPLPRMDRPLTEGGSVLNDRVFPYLRPLRWSEGPLFWRWWPSSPW